MSEYLDYLGDVEYAKDKINDLALKMYQQGYADALDIDMDKPMNFTDEQKAWVKKYIIRNGKANYERGARDFAEWLNARRCFGEWYKFDGNEEVKLTTDEILSEWQKGEENDNT